ncbi:MAG: hypothetical protein V4662_11870 [Verrucomicrobiota bacterium]
MSRREKHLSGKQRSTLAMVAGEAYKRLKQGLSETADEFRRTEARACTQQLKNAPPEGWTISEAPASAFDTLFAHFKALKGDTDVALDYHLGPGTEMRNALHNITVAERAAGVTPAYTAAICRNMKFGDAPRTPKEAKAVLIALTKKAEKDAKLRAGEEVEA